MINLRNSPFLWLALILLAALGLGESIRITPHGLLFYICLALGVVGGMMCLLSYSPRFYYGSTIGLSLFIFCGGLIHQSAFTNHLYPAPVFNKLHQMEGRVIVEQVLKVKPGLTSLQCRNISLQEKRDTNTLLFSDRNILVQIRDPDSTAFLPGDLMWIKGWLSAIQGPLNPHAFDPRAYYNTLGVRHQLFAKSENVSREPCAPFSFQRMTADWQRKLSGMVRNHTSAASAQVINALVWGDRSDMDTEVRDAFADSGAMHVLSVSGMHVAMIYSMLFLILGAPGEGTLGRRIIRFALYGMAILLYVGLTGACAAVVRAGLMILLYLFGKSMGWNTQVWNLIGFAAFMMMWLNPFNYHNIGFQLSFLAMAGILLFAKPIIRSLSFKSKIMHALWEIVALSLAAQVFILPIVLRQFHQFPLTFIISSIVAIPAGYVVIAGALLNVVLSAIGIDLLWPLLDKACSWFIDSMKWMAGLNPDMQYSLPALGSSLLMLLAVMFSFSLMYRWNTGKKIAYGCGCLVVLHLCQHRIQQWRSDEIVMYHSFKGFVMDIFEKGYCTFIRDDALTKIQIEFPTRGHRCHKDVIACHGFSIHSAFQSNTLTYQQQILKKKNLRLLLFDDDVETESLMEPLTHIVFLAGSDRKKTESLLCQNPDAQIILAASCPKKDARLLIRMLQGMGRSYHEIGQQGYYQLKL